MRGGPRGEPRIFETPEEFNELSRGASPKYMNGQFRYYLASVAMVQPQGECKTPLLAVNVAVENLHGTPTAAIYGEFTFTQVVGGDGSSLTETVAVPFHANIIGPFSNKQGGFVYATAFLEQTDPRATPSAGRRSPRSIRSGSRSGSGPRPSTTPTARSTAAHRQGRGPARGPDLRRQRRRPVAPEVGQGRAPSRAASQRQSSLEGSVKPSIAEKWFFPGCASNSPRLPAPIQRPGIRSTGARTLRSRRRLGDQRRRRARPHRKER